MRRILSGPEPKGLTEGRARLKATPGIGDDWYDRLDGAAKDAVRSQRLQEQGHLCAYTEIRLANDLHIEHMYPQDHCSPEEKIAYDNMVICWPDGSGNPGFGAIEKDNWPDQSQRRDFVRPVDSHCDERFRYTNDGGIAPTDPQDRAAKETIANLKLDAKPLCKLRREAIVAQLDGLHRVDTARKRLTGLGPDSHGHEPQFISARRQALERLLDKLERIRKYAKPRVSPRL